MTRRPADTNANADGGAGKAPQLRPSGLDRSADGGATWERTNSNNVRPFYYSQVRLDPKDPNRVYWSSTPVNFSNDGGKTVGNATVGIHVDHHAMWIDPNDPNHIVVGNDGGVAQSWDKGGNWDFLNSFARLRPGESLQRFDVSPEGKGLMFERVRENSDVVLIELPRP